MCSCMSLQWLMIQLQNLKLNASRALERWQIKTSIEIYQNVLDVRRHVALAELNYLMASSAGQLSRWCKFQGQKTSTIHGSAFNSCSNNKSFEWILPNNCFCFSTFKLHEKNSSDDFCSCLTMCLSFYLYLIYEVLVDGSQLTPKVWCSI